MASKKTLTAKNLSALGADWLADLMIEVTKGNAAAKRRLRLELAGEDGPGELARDVARRLATIGRSRRFIDWQRAPALIADLHMQRRAIIERIAPAQPDLGFDLIWRLHALSTGVYERADDSNGRLQDFFHDLGPDVVALANAAKPDPETLADRLASRLPEDDWGHVSDMIKPRSAERYRVSMRNLLPHFEGQRLGEINATTLRAFENARRGDGVAVGTIRRDLQCLSSIITVFCDEHDLEFANPVQRYLRRRARQKALVEAPPRIRYLDHEEEARLLATIRARTENDPRLRYLAEAVEFAIDTGLRLEEQFSMTWREYDPRRQRVRVRPEIAKSGEERIVPLLTERAKSILAQMPRRLRLAGEPDWIWSRPDGDRYPHREKAFKSAVAAAGLKDVRWHDLRRTSGCRRIQDHGWKLEEVKALLGHSSVVVTEKIYAFLRVEDLEAVPTRTRHKAD